MPAHPDPNALVTASLGAHRVQVSRQLVNYWRITGKITPVATDKRGRALYRLRDIVRVERDTKQSAQSHRRCPQVDYAHAQAMHRVR